MTKACPECGEENPRVVHGKMEWEVVQEPKRGERGVGNVDFCKNCGGVIGLSREIPTIKT